MGNCSFFVLSKGAVQSGLAAISVPLRTFLSAGDHVLITDSVYGPTRRFANEMQPRMGISAE
ncbi:PLP-dependent transferase [Bosea sp. ASV33]|uniref:PLP-dependent transferase n=1 Tax=Bosea sp. ASV33 TaxID=2795106 RepID=UPI0018EE25AB